MSVLLSQLDQDYIVVLYFNLNLLSNFFLKVFNIHVITKIAVSAAAIGFI